MATLFDGSRVFTGVAGNTALAADQNTIQDKCILGFEERWWPIHMTAGRNDNTGTWEYRVASGYWTDTTPTSGGLLVLPVILPDDAYITEVAAWIKGSVTNNTGGFVKLYKNTLGVAAAVQTLDDTDPWTVGAVTKVEATGLSIQVSSVADYEQYYLLFQNSDTSPSSVNQVHSAFVKARFHVGT